MEKGRKHPPANLDAEVSADGARLGVSGVGLTQHHPASLHNIQTLPHLHKQIKPSSALHANNVTNSEA